MEKNQELGVGNQVGTGSKGKVGAHGGDTLK